MKHCTKCLREKSETEFHVRRASPDGLAYNCRECVNAKTKEWQAQNPGAFRRWSAANAAGRAAYMRDWSQRNASERTQAYRDWVEQNRPRVVARNMARKAVTKQATPPWANPAAIQAFYDEAARLTRETGVRHEVDHVYPLKGKTVSGLHVEANLQILTRSENARKRNKMPTQAA